MSAVSAAASSCRPTPREPRFWQDEEFVDLSHPTLVLDAQHQHPTGERGCAGPRVPAATGGG
ncbi:MAG: hypothetical protein E6K34_14230 [Gammaproteobacteria bacterium]|nr:MAG: hypothetical protein E6K34_14230 [Gammaproteobacteria bacterium]TLZ30155.1 MAG: hypothetical protein E6K25_08600 [Gammaproteobacteria bacterium]TLZ50379.1 MAG: hypothetical protein E6K21_02995 [Gammaproteobacteria bacterium]